MHHYVGGMEVNLKIMRFAVISIIVLIVCMVIVTACDTLSDGNDKNAMSTLENTSEGLNSTEELILNDTYIEYYDGGILPFLVEGFIMPEGENANRFDQAKFTDTGDPIRIPVYNHFDLLFEGRYTTGGEFVTELSYNHLQCRLVLGRDGYVSPIYSMGDSMAGRLLTLAPTTALRNLQDDTGCGYLIYQTTEGARLFVFLLAEHDGATRYGGYPILMRKTLVHANFSAIKIGSTTSEILAIDPVMQDYIKQFNATYDFYLTTGGDVTQLEFISVHLLTDGVLKFTYSVSNGDFTISGIEFSSDFILDDTFANLDGCYKILMEDYLS